MDLAGAAARFPRGNVRWHFFAGLVVALLGAAVLTGWLLDIALLQSIRPGWPSMKASAAFGLVLSGAALWQLRAEVSKGWTLRLAQACAGLAALLGLLSLAEYIFKGHLGVDNLLLANSLEAMHSARSGRMVPNVATALLFGNSALLLLAGATNPRTRLAAAVALAVLTLLLGLFGTFGFIGGQALVPIVGMSLHGAMAFSLLGSAVLSIAWIRAGWRWSISTPVVVGVALCMLILLGLSLEAMRSARGFVDTSLRVHHTQEVRTDISDLNAALAIEIGGERGFVITGRDDFFARYTHGTRTSLDAAERLRELTADNPRQQARLDRLGDLLREKLEFTQQVLEAQRAGDSAVADGLIDSGRWQHLVDAIYTLTAEMEDEEVALLAQREAQSAASIERTVLILSTGTLLALGLFLGALLYLNAEATERQRIAAEVGASEARFRSLALATSQIVWTTDPSGQVNHRLPSWQAYTGQDDDDIAGFGWTKALHPDDIERALSLWTQAVENRSLYEVECKIRRHDGIYRDFSVRGVTVLNSDASVREWIGSCADVTERRKAEAERDRFFSLSLDLMCIASMEGRFLRINRAFETTLGFSETELLSRPYLDFVHPDDRASTLDVMKSLTTGVSAVNFENRFVCKDGSARWLHWSTAPVVEEGKLYAVAHDITARKRVDAEVRQLNAELDQRVIERTAQLESVNRELEAFTYSVSHDLRAPLRGVDSFSRMVIEDYGPKLDDEGRRMLNVVRSESQRMGALIDDLLQFSRVGRQEIRHELINMSALVQSVIDRMDLSAEREAHIDVRPMPPAYGDRNLIQQVWVNLLSNALKFTVRQPAPAIEIGGSMAEGLATFYVKDNGAGFDTRFAHKLFGVFQRLHTEDEFEGTGVGLALVKRIVQRHGGTVCASGEVDKGAAFYFALPMAKEHAA